MKLFGKIMKYAAILLICLMCLIPFYVLLVLALNSPQRVFYEGNIFVPDFCWQNFVDAWHKSRIGTAMVNSAIITAGTLLLTIITGGLAGYAIARHNTRYNKLVFGLLLSSMMIPGIINTVPLYTLMRKLHAVNTLWGMILVCSTLALPSAVFIYATFIKALPKELDEAAALDGCTGFSTFWRVIFPVIKPATASFVILNGFGILRAGGLLFAIEIEAEYSAGIVRFLPAVRRRKMAPDGSNCDNRRHPGGADFPDLPEAVYQGAFGRRGERIGEKHGLISPKSTVFDRRGRPTSAGDRG